METIAIPPARVRRLVTSAFKVRGLSLSVAALKVLQEALEGCSRDDVQLALDEVLSTPQMLDLSTSVVSEQDVHGAIETLKRTGDADQQGGISSASHFQVLDVFNDVTQYTYNPVRKTFLKRGIPSSIHGTAQTKIEMFRERYQVLFQRLQRDPMFTTPVNTLSGTTSAKPAFTITPIESLITSGGKKFIFGMLTLGEGGMYHIEDLNSSVPVDLSQAIENENFAAGLYTENSIVVAEGRLVGTVFRVEMLGMPPAEPRATSLDVIGAVDMFGGVSPSETKEQLVTLEGEDPAASFAFIADVHLDQPKVMRALRTMFEGYAATRPPTAMIFLGNFLSSPVGQGGLDVKTVRGLFGNLGKLIAEFPVLLDNCTFVFLPGDKDPCPSVALPRSRISQVFTADLERRVPNAQFVSTPCRLRFFSKEIVIHRQPILQTMRKHCIVPPSNETDEVRKHMCKTILDQGHLSPLPLHVAPILWPFDHALRLYPLPDVLVLGDRYDQWEDRIAGCLCFNPGPFSTDFSFMSYMPALNETEYNRIPEDGTVV